MNRVKVFFKGEAKESFEKLNSLVREQIKNGNKNSSEIRILKSIKNKIELIKQNPFYGDNIKKKLIPEKYKTQNLWRIELTNFWRMLYTIRGDDLEIFCFILDITDHKKYNRIFGYK